MYELFAFDIVLCARVKKKGLNCVVFVYINEARIECGKPHYTKMIYFQP